MGMTQGITLAQAARLLQPLQVAGRWYWPPLQAPLTTGVAIGTSKIVLLPFSILAPITISDLAAIITTASAGGLFQMGIYASDPVTAFPTAPPAASTGSISTTSTGLVTGDITGADVRMPAGEYWAGFMADNATVAFVTLAAFNTLSMSMVGSTSSASLGTTARTRPSYAVTGQTFGTFPDLTGQALTETVSANNDAILAYKVSAVG